jgi:mono/diheme cytochrome c family protein
LHLELWRQPSRHDGRPRDAGTKSASRFVSLRSLGTRLSQSASIMENRMKGYFFISVFLMAMASAFANGPAAPAASAPQAGAQTASKTPANTKTPVQLADSTPKGQLKDPYSDKDAAVVAAGKQLFEGTACAGCHGGGGGGDMCPPLTNGVWIYGGDNDTLFRLVTYGSKVLQSKGYTRQAQENVVAPMPAMGEIVKTADDLWKILTFVRSRYDGPPECKYGCKGS